jgi:hypothetical protein
MTFNSEITLGNLATVVAVIVSAATLVYSWRKDRVIRIRERSDRIRQAASATLAGIVRWQEVMTWYYVEALPLFISTANNYAATKQPEKVRDDLWKELQGLRTATLRRAFEERLETTYTGLLTYDSTAHDWFAELLQRLKKQDESSYEKFLIEVQEAIRDAKPDSPTADLGNELRTLAVWRRRMLLKSLRDIATSAEDFLIEIVKQPDNPFRIPTSPLVSDSTTKELH